VTKPPVKTGGFFLACLIAALAIALIDATPGFQVLTFNGVFKSEQKHKNVNHEFNIHFVYLVFHADLRGAFLCFHAAKSE